MPSTDAGEAPIDFVQLLQNAPYEYYQPTVQTHKTSIPVVKHYLDSLASEISRAQLARLKESRKRKRHAREPEDEVLRLKKIHTEGFGWNQVWEQARRVITASLSDLDDDLGRLEQAGSPDGNIGPDEQLQQELGAATEVVVISSDDDSSSGSGEEVGLNGAEEFDSDEDSIEEAEEAGNHNELESDIEAGSENSEENENGRADKFVADTHGLNDGFFSIDDFNRRIEFLEEVDARGDGNDGAASDEEDVDWDAAPTGDDVEAKSRSKGGVHGGGSEEDSDDEAGPTFGNMDLHAPEGASDEENDDMEIEDGEDGNADSFMYGDFFAPPAHKPSKKPKKNRQARKEAEEYISLHTEDDEVQRTISAVHRDIFSDGDDEEDEQDPKGPNGPLSSHERRQATLLGQIRELEAASIAKRDWTLSGEAIAADRPVNSLLAEDLDFERAGKPVLVVTKELTEDMEAMIKRRIIAREFDEVLRRRPDEALSNAAGRRGLLEEVQDTKSQKGLAAIYEEEHLRTTDPNYVDARDERLKVAHREIEGLWKDISGKLDALASWNYRPRPVEMSIQVRSDAPVVMMEDARPSGVGGSEVATANHLAPQEVYKAGKELQKGEVVTKGGTVIAKDEMSREDRKRLRRQAKERAKNAVATAEPVASDKQDAKTKTKTNVVKDLKRGGVMIVDKKGNLSTVDGKAARGNQAFVSGSSFKL